MAAHTYLAFLFIVVPEAPYRLAGPTTRTGQNGRATIATRPLRECSRSRCRAAGPIATPNIRRREHRPIFRQPTQPVPKHGCHNGARSNLRQTNASTVPKPDGRPVPDR